MVLTYELDNSTHVGRLTGEVVTAAIGNTHWRDNLNYLYSGRPVVTAWMQTTQTVTTTTWTKVAFTVKPFEQGATWTIGTDTVIPEAGVYLLVGKTLWDTNTTNERRVAIWTSASGVFPNGRFGETSATSSLSGNGTDQTTSTVISLAASTTVSLVCWQNSGTDRTIVGEASYGGYTTLTIARIA